MLTAVADDRLLRDALRPAAASSRAPRWLHGTPAPAQVVGVFDQAVYLHRCHEVLPILAPEALALPGGMRLAGRQDLLALGLRVGEEVTVGLGKVLTATGGLAVRRTWRPRQVPAAPLTATATARALAALPGDPGGDDPAVSHVGHLAQFAVRSLATDPGRARATVRSMVGLGPGLTPAGDDALCGLLLGLRATGRDGEHAVLERAVTALLDRTTALSATLLGHAADGYAVPAMVDLLHAWHAEPSAAELVAAADRVAAVGHSSGPALLRGLAAALHPIPHPGPVTPTRGTS